MAADTEAARRQLARTGLAALAPDAALAALGQVMDDGETAVTVADVDWDRFAAGFGPGRPSPLLTGVPEVRRIEERATGRVGAPAATDRLGRAHRRRAAPGTRRTRAAPRSPPSSGSAHRRGAATDRPSGTSASTR